MELHLHPDLERHVGELVAGGVYASAEEVVADALYHLWRERVASAGLTDPLPEILRRYAGERAAAMGLGSADEYVLLLLRLDRQRHALIEGVRG